jgi:hypothetical protein
LSLGRGVGEGYLRGSNASQDPEAHYPE